MKFEHVRFNSSVLVILSFGFMNVILGSFIKYLRNLSILSFFGSIVLYSWYSLFGAWISRSRRAVFNEHNVMLTYQPRFLTHGHLFTPDPPTPVPNSSANQGSKESFAKARDDHYKDEYAYAKKRAAETSLHQPMGQKVEAMRIEFEDDTSLKTENSETKMI